MDIDPYEYNPLIKIEVDGKKPITGEIASAATDVDMFQGWLPVMENPDEVLRLEAGGDISIYDKIGRDPRVAASLRTRAKAVTAREWQIVPFSQEAIDIKIQEYCTEVFKNFPYDRSRRPVLRGGNLKGYAVSEVMWDYSEGDVFIKNMLYRHQRRFRYAPNGDLHLLTLENPYPGINASRDQATGLLLKKFQVYTFGDEITTPYGNGLGQELYWPWWFKRNGIKYWLVFVEKFAAPTAAGEYPAGTDKGKQQELLSAASSLHSNSAIVYPQGMNLRLIEAARTGSITCYKELADFCNDEMTICILGQTATTSGKPGGLGNADEQQQVLEDYLKDDGDSLCESQNDRQNGVIPWLVDYQFPGHGRYPKIEIKTEDEEDAKTLAERDDKLSQAMARSGKKLSLSYYMRVHGLEEGDIEEIETQPPPPTNKRGGGAEVSFSEAGNLTEVDLCARLAGKADPAVTKWVEGLRALTNKATDLQELAGMAADAFPGMSTEALAGIVAEHLVRSQMGGRLDVENGE